MSPTRSWPARQPHPARPAAFTPRDRNAVRAAARTFRANPALDTDATITAQGVGEALASTLDADGIPTIVERIRVAPPGSRLGPITLD